MLPNHRYADSIYCDGCGELIAEAESAHILWFRSDTPETDDGRCYHVHKGACDDRVEAEHGAGRMLLWAPLTHHLLNLLHNTGKKTKRALAAAKDNADLWSSIR
jgi:hypothetical protein